MDPTAFREKVYAAWQTAEKLVSQTGELKVEFGNLASHFRQLERKAAADTDAALQLVEGSRAEVADLEQLLAAASEENASLEVRLDEALVAAAATDKLRAEAAYLQGETKYLRTDAREAEDQLARCRTNANFVAVAMFGVGIIIGLPLWAFIIRLTS